MSTLTYINHPNPQCSGNPLIEAMGYPMTLEDIRTRCGELFNGDISLEGVPEEHHAYYLRSIIDNLMSTYVTQDEAYAIYEKLRRMIEVGYKIRNPLDSIFRNRMLTAIHSDDKNQLEAFNLKQVTGESPDSMLTANASFLLAGLSGRGKTTMMLRILKLLNQTYQHTQYTKKDGEIVNLDIDQITYLYVQIHKRKGQKAFLRSVIEAVQYATKIPYMDEMKKKGDSVDEMIRFVRKLLIKHNVGILIIDEAQNFAATPDHLQLGANEQTSMKFVEEIFNRIGVPLFFIGTMSTLKLFGKEMTIGRRALNDGSLLMVSCDVEGSFWSRLFQEICPSYLLKGEHSESDFLMRHLHMLSAGMPAIAVSLMRATLSHLSKFEPGKQNLTIEALSYVFKEQFSILHKPLKVVHSGKNYHKYEDLEVMAELKEINEEISAGLKSAEKDYVSQTYAAEIENLPATDTEAEARVEKSLNAVKTVRVKSEKSRQPSVTPQLADKIKTSNLLVADLKPSSREVKGV